MRIFSSILEAIQTRYRIAKYHYDCFYRERIQATLAGCLYNEGRRKLKRFSAPLEPQFEQNESSRDVYQTTLTIAFD